MSKPLGIAAAIVSVLLLGLSVRADDAISVETIAAALQAQLSSIHSIDVVYEQQSEPSEFERKLAKERGMALPAGGPRLMEWAEQGELLLLGEFSKDDPNRFESAMTFDGEKAYHLFPRDKSALRLDVNKTMQTAYWKKATPAFAYGWRVWLTGQSLPALLRLPGARLVGPETIADRECLRLEVEGAKASSGVPIKVAVHLDPGHDFLPVRVLVQFDTDESPANTFRMTWNANQFMRVGDFADGQERWFPSEAVFIQTIGSTFTFIVKSVRINESLPAKKFRPKAPDDTSVVDHSAPDQPRKYLLGGRAAEDAAAARRAAEAKRLLDAAATGPSVVIDARPQPTNYHLTTLLCLSAVVCLALAFVWYRRSHQ